MAEHKLIYIWRGTQIFSESFHLKSQHFKTTLTAKLSRIIRTESAPIRRLVVMRGHRPAVSRPLGTHIQWALQEQPHSHSQCRILGL